MEIKDRIRNLRIANDWTPRYLAQAMGAVGAGISWRTVESWEQGRRIPSIKAMKALIKLGLETEAKT